MSKPIAADNKPTRVELEEGRKYFYCTCGRSSNQPYCDGSHSGSGLAPMAFNAEKTGTAFLCACKQSSNFPFCDGSHKEVPDDQVGKE